MHKDRSAIYAPEEVLLFRRIFGQALRSLPAGKCTAENRSRIVRNLLACAATGERDPVELRIAALAGLDAIAA